MWDVLFSWMGKHLQGSPDMQVVHFLLCAEWKMKVPFIRHDIAVSFYQAAHPSLCQIGLSEHASIQRYSSSGLSFRARGVPEQTKFT
jgi:hypothetical protein